MESLVRIGVIGFGNWGPRIARVLSELPGAEVPIICDLRPKVLETAARRYPGVRTTTNPQDVFNDPKVAAVYIATPVGTHEALVLEALKAGKDVLVEKPLAANSAAAERCVRAAEANQRILMVGHTFVYSPPVRKIRELVTSGDLGRLFYLTSSRVNLGLFQKDVSVIWDLVPHDLSILLYVTGGHPVSVASHGKAFFGANNLEDVADLTVELDNGVVGYLHVSWLAPVKLRRTTLVGDKKMIVYDDVEPVEKVKIFDRRVERLDVGPTFGEFQLTYRFGDVVSPVLSSEEPLALEAKAFIKAIQTREAPESDGRFGLEIVRVLELADQSCRTGGVTIRVDGK